MLVGRAEDEDGRDVAVYAKQFIESMIEVKAIGVGTANYVAEGLVEAEIDTV